MPSTVHVNKVRGEESTSQIPWGVTGIVLAIWAVVLVGIAFWVRKRVRLRRES